MPWTVIEQEIRIRIKPNKTKILKCDGIERRLVVSNDGHEIGIKTGVQTDQSKAITYDMVKYAYEVLTKKGRFDSADFQRKYKSKYKAAPCRFSMVGGVLVELGAARLISVGGRRSCYYTRP